ncbi:hypothetical protein SGRI78S_00021 [Streptomyces griseus subsp. griseus]
MPWTPEEFGGGGLSALDTMLVEEQFGHAKDILIRRAFGNVYEVLLGANEAQRERWLLPTVRGDRTCAIAITEPGAGSDAGSIRTRAVRQEDHWVLTGGKHFISDGEFSRLSSSPQSRIRRPARVASRSFWWTKPCPA